MVETPTKTPQAAAMELSRVIRQTRQSVLTLSFQTNSTEAITEVITRAEEMAAVAQRAGFYSHARRGMRMAAIVRSAASAPYGVRSEHIARLHGLLSEAFNHQVGN